MAVQTTDSTSRGPRHYFTEDQPQRLYPSVTAIINMLPKQDFLSRWNANMAADLALSSLDILPAMAQRDIKGAKQYLAGAAKRYGNDRAKIGSKAHVLFEKMIRGQDVGFVHPDMKPYVLHFAQFLDAVKPELVFAEDVAWSDTHRFAGSFDSLLRVRLDENGQVDQQGESSLHVTDWKTGRNTYPDVSLQLTAYARADFIMAADGSTQPMPAVDGGFVLHITDEEWSFKPAEVSDRVFAQFLHLRETFKWDREIAKQVLGKPIAGSAAKFVTGTERRA